MRLFNADLYMCCLKPIPFYPQVMLSALEQNVLKDHFRTIGKRSGIMVVVVIATVGPLRLAIKHFAKTKRRHISKAATLGVLPEKSVSSRLRDGEHLTDDEFQALTLTLVGDLGWYLTRRVLVAAAWECVSGIFLVGICKGLDTHCPQLVTVLPEVNGERSALTFILMVSNVRSSTISRIVRLPKWWIPGGSIQTSAPLDNAAIAEFCSNCTPLHLLGWELLIPSSHAPIGMRLLRYAAVIAFGYAGMRFQCTYPLAERGGAYNGSIAALLFN